MDSIPLVVITGRVPTGLIGSDAFQEADTIGITRHCTKHNYLVKDPSELAAIIGEAFQIATTGRPVVIGNSQGCPDRLGPAGRRRGAAADPLQPAFHRARRRYRPCGRTDRRREGADLLHRRQRHRIRPRARELLRQLRPIRARP